MGGMHERDHVNTFKVLLGSAAIKEPSFNFRGAHRVQLAVGDDDARRALGRVRAGTRPTGALPNLGARRATVARNTGAPREPLRPVANAESSAVSGSPPHVENQSDQGRVGRRRTVRRGTRARARAAEDGRRSRPRRRRRSRIHPQQHRPPGTLVGLAPWLARETGGTARGRGRRLRGHEVGRVDDLDDLAIRKRNVKRHRGREEPRQPSDPSRATRLDTVNRQRREPALSTSTTRRSGIGRDPRHHRTAGSHAIKRSTAASATVSRQCRDRVAPPRHRRRDNVARCVPSLSRPRRARAGYPRQRSPTPSLTEPSP